MIGHIRLFLSFASNGFESGGPPASAGRDLRRNWLEGEGFQSGIEGDRRRWRQRAVVSGHRSVISGQWLVISNR